MTRFLTVLCTIFTISLFGQDWPPYIFQDRMVINSPSTETLPKRVLDIRISHRFGDMFGDNGGWENFYGLENARDVSIGIEYGVTDQLLFGLNRAAGAGPLQQLVNVYLKYRVAGNNPNNPNPTAVSFLAYASTSTMPKSEESSAITFFPEFLHRVAYHFQGIVGRRFSQTFSGQVNIGYTHRNYVNTDEENYLLNVGGAFRIKTSKAIAFIAEANFPIRFEDEIDVVAPIGVGLEWETGGGHIFQFNLTNASGLSIPDYLAFTRSEWSDGEFRLGFTISRKFKL